jgi:hypothetical protein
MGFWQHGHRGAAASGSSRGAGNRGRPEWKPMRSRVALRSACVKRLSRARERSAAQSALSNFQPAFGRTPDSSQGSFHSVFGFNLFERLRGIIEHSQLTIAAGGNDMLLPNWISRLGSDGSAQCALSFSLFAQPPDAMFTLRVSAKSTIVPDVPRRQFVG